MTAPDLPPEQREVLFDALYRVDMGMATRYRRSIVEQDLAPTVALMLADARAEGEQIGRDRAADAFGDGEERAYKKGRAEGDRQGAARVAAAVEAVAVDLESEVDWSGGRNNYGDNEAWEASARRIRAALAEAQEGTP